MCFVSYAKLSPTTVYQIWRGYPCYVFFQNDHFFSVVNLPTSVVDPSPPSPSSPNNVCSTKLPIPSTEHSGVSITAPQLDGGGLDTGVACGVEITLSRGVSSWSCNWFKEGKLFRRIIRWSKIFYCVYTGFIQWLCRWNRVRKTGNECVTHNRLAKNLNVLTEEAGSINMGYKSFILI